MRKISFILAGILCLLFSASPLSASENTAQLLQKKYDVNISISQATVKSFCDAFTGQTGVPFSYEAAVASQKLGNVDLHRSDTSLESLLDLVFGDSSFKYQIVGNNVVITQKAVASSKSDRLTVRGRVVDDIGEPLIGAGVFVKNSTGGTITDADGRYSIEAQTDDVLVFSYIGCDNVEESVNGRATINVVLVNSIVLDDAVVVGYGTQSRKTLTTSIAKVDGDDLLNTPAATVADALKGKVTGLYIVSNNNIAGESPMFMIRGGSSINRSNTPLCLVDGIERSFDDLNPNDIESIEVLKDAASSSIYGSRGSNGVILVTTRKGDRYQAPQIVFDAQVGFTSPARKWDLANASEYLSIIRPAALQGPNSTLVLDGANGAGTGNTASTAIYSTRYYEEGMEIPEGWQTMADPIDPSKTLMFCDNDWQSDWYSPAFYQKEYIGVNGGNENVRYAASISYLQDLGMVAMSGYQNFTMHGNTTFKITKNLEASTTFDYTRNLKETMTSNIFSTVGRGILMSPTHIGTYEDGSYATGGTNVNQQTAAFYEDFYDRENSRNKFTGNFNLKWTIIPGLTANALYAIYDTNYRGSYYAYGEVTNDQGAVTTNYVSATRNTSESRTQTLRHNAQAYIAFDREFGKHKVNATVGTDFWKSSYYSLSASSSGAENDKLPYLQSGSKGDVTTGEVSTFDAENNEYDTAMLSFFGRVGYNYDDRYVASASFRADGSSLFAKGNRWGYFPSASAAWIISEEPFYSQSLKDVMNNLKVRVSYGLTGNNDISRTAPLGSYILSDYAGYATLLPSAMANSSLGWETTRQLDVGIDIGFMKDRFRLIVDYYDKVSDNMIFSITLPDTGQYSSVQANVGSARFYGFEVELHTVNIETKNFTWETDFTYSFNRNKVLSLPEEYAYEIVDMDGNPTGEIGYRIGGYTTANGYRFGGIAVGEPLGRIWGYKIAGILQTEEEAAAALYDEQSHGYRRSDGLSITGRKDVGDYEWVNRYGTSKTADGEEMINSEDMFCLGNVNPHSTGGINNTFRWKRLTCSIYFDYALGHSIYNYMKSRLIQNSLGYSNANVDVGLFTQTWRYPGDDATAARFFPNDADYGNRNFSRCSDYNVENASYLCLRDVSLYYDLPDKWAKAMKMKKFTIGVTGNTLCYFTKLSGAISPETGIASDADGTEMYSSVQMGSSNSNITPSARKIMFNVKITF